MRIAFPSVQDRVEIFVFQVLNIGHFSCFKMYAIGFKYMPSNELKTITFCKTLSGQKYLSLH